MCECVCGNICSADCHTLSVQREVGRVVLVAMATMCLLVVTTCLLFLCYHMTCSVAFVHSSFVLPVSFIV